MQNTQIESLKHQLQGISARFEKINEDKEIIEQRVGELETKVSELNVQNGELKSEIEALKVKQPEIVSEGQPILEQPPIPHVTGTIKPMGAKFIMTDFEEWRKDSDVWFSPHFYTHPNGYKMCLRVDANGIGSFRGTHLSVHVYLMQGNFDDQLKWPFQGNITFKLVNQEEDEDHVIKTVYSSRAPSERLERVTTKGRIDNAWGINNFLPHTELQPKYLKNNCIKLCIKSIEFH